MNKRSGPPPIVLILGSIVLIGLGYWFLIRKDNPSGQNPSNSNVSSGSISAPSSVDSGTEVRIDGATSMVQINEKLKLGFQQKFPGTKVLTNAGGSDKGLQDLMDSKVDLAAVSRPLTQQELGQGLTAIEVTKDAIAIVVGNGNNFGTNLTNAQVKGIFQGQITDWSQIGTTSGPIQVINRPMISGTHQVFKDLVLNGGNFGSGPNFTTLERDATTPLLQALKNNGIGYATYAQVAAQKTIRTVMVDNLTPDMPNYPLKRSLYYVSKNPSPGALAFLGYATSAEAQQLLIQSN